MEDERNTTQYTHQENNAADEVEVKERGLFDTLLGRNKKPEDDLEKKQEEDLVAGMGHVSVPAEPEKKEEYDEHDAAAGGGQKKESLLAKLHRTGSSSSSSSDEEEEEYIDDNGEIARRRKKKGLKEKIKEKLPGGHKDPKPYDGLDDGEHKAPYAVPAPVATHAYDHHQEVAEHKPYAVPAPAPPVATAHAYQSLDDDHKAYVPAAAPAHVHDNGASVVIQKEEEEEEKKGILEKLKEKLPGGGHKKPEDAAAAPPPNYGEEVDSPDAKEKKQGLLGKIMDKIPGYNKGPAEEDHKADAAAGEHKTSS